MNAPVFELQSPPPAKRQRPRRGGWTWGPVEGARLRALSCGAGVQTTALILMTCLGEVGPRPDVMLFADTVDEAPSTMRHLDWLEGEVARLTNGQMECRRVSAGRLSDRLRARAAGAGSRKQDRFVTIPAFTANGGRGKRQCTRDFKIEPLKREQRALMGFKPRQRIPAGSAEIWIGISVDEVVRAGSAHEVWAVNRYPLLELGMSRSDCERWLTDKGYPVPPKSACVQCPNRTNAEWRWLRDNDPEAFEEACKIDELIRQTPGMRNAEFLHRSLKPLREVDLSTAEDRGQRHLFLDHCDGMCGL